MEIFEITQQFVEPLLSSKCTLRSPPSGCKARSDQAVAYGAAVQAAVLSGNKALIDVLIVLGVWQNGSFHPFSCGYGSIPINTIFRGMNIHLPAILMWTTGVQGFDTLPCENNDMMIPHWLQQMTKNLTYRGQGKDSPLKDIVLLDVTPLSLGLETAGGVMTRRDPVRCAECRRGNDLFMQQLKLLGMWRHVSCLCYLFLFALYVLNIHIYMLCVLYYICIA